MNCPACHAVVPPPSDPMQRHAACPSCGKAIDLASAADGATTRQAPVSRPAPAPADPMIGRDFAGGRYRVESLLGVGGMGRVYTATQRGLSRSVALKILSPEFARDEQFRRRFDREAGTLASLEHPHIVTVHDVGVEEDTPYIVMSLVKGPKGVPTSLRDVLDAGPMEEEWALRIVQQTCSALEYAHGRGVIHRDIKPGNILLDAQGGAKIADFGIARVGGGGDLSQLTHTGAVLGTMRYMAPEQMVDSAHVDARSDLYSLGVVLYEMLTGEAPVGRFDLPSEAKKGLDRRLDGIVDRALRRVTTQRYQSASEMARDLSRITTEREYGRMVGAGGLAAAATADSAPKSGGVGGGTPGIGAIAIGGRPATAVPEVSPAQGAEAGSASVPAPAIVARPRRPAWVLPAVGVALVGAIVGAVFLFKGGDAVKPAPKEGAAPPVAPPTLPPFDPKRPLVPPAGKDAPPTPDPTPTPKPEPPKPQPPKPDAGDDEPTDEASLSADDRQELADAKKTILQLISFGSRISAEDMESEDTSLPEVKGTDLPGAVTAVKRSLELWKGGKTKEVADRVPDALLASIAKARGVAPADARKTLASLEYGARLDSIGTGKSVAIGADWALVRYDVIVEGGGASSQVAVCVREGGVWKVFL